MVKVKPSSDSDYKEYLTLNIVNRTHEVFNYAKAAKFWTFLSLGKVVWHKR